MKNDIEILKLFTRKLANCKYSVPADKLTQYLKEGSFGYTFDPKGDNLITNDSVFADEVATAKCWEVFQPLVSNVAPDYKVVIVMAKDAPASN